MTPYQLIRQKVVQRGHKPALVPYLLAAGGLEALSLLLNIRIPW